MIGCGLAEMTGRRRGTMRDEEDEELSKTIVSHTGALGRPQRPKRSLQFDLKLF